MKNRTVIFCSLLCAGAFTAQADFTYEETTAMTGGPLGGVLKAVGAFSKQAREAAAPTTATMIVKGNRMANLSREKAHIIDLDKETITNIDFAKKTYSVMTFQQMKEMMEEMTNRMQGRRGAPAGAGADIQYKASIKETGAKKQIAGLDAHEVILTLQAEGADKETGNRGALGVSVDMWLATEVAGYQEVRDFRNRMALKMAWTPGAGSGAAMMQPGMMHAMAEAAKEADKMKGMAVMKVTTMGGSASSQDGRSAASGNLMELTTQMTSFSGAPADTSKFEVPTGFQQVDSEMMRMKRR